MRYLVLALLISSSCQSRTEGPEAKPSPLKIKFETLVEKEDVIWGFDFLPDKRVIVTVRSGEMFIYDPTTKKTTKLKGLPKIYSAGQAGLLDVRVHPDFKKNNHIYFTFSEPVGEDQSTTVLGVAELKGDELKNYKPLFKGVSANDNDIHYGSRIEFDNKGHLFVSMGDRGERHKAQSLDNHIGKIMRLNLDGSIPDDNPYKGVKGSKSEIWSYGHRNPQGLTIHPNTGELWEAEMGPRGGDEVNLIEAKKNYGWPEVSYGREYHGPKIGEKQKPGMEQPLVYWVPSISPSGISFYTGDKIPEWKKSLFLANLSGNHIRRVVFNGKKVEKQEKILEELGYRWRSVRTGPDGYLYFGTDEGRFGRIVLK